MDQNKNIYKCPVNKIKIGPFDYEIRWIDNAEVNSTGRHGQSDNDYNILYVVSTINKWRMIDTILHEINHTIIYIFGLKITNSEDKIIEKTDEQYADALASGWVMVNRDNPTFRKWLNNLY